METLPEDLSQSLDEALYSRQLYVLGKEAMTRLSNSSILVSGIGGLGIEIAKNIILAGVKSVTLQDTKLATRSDLSSQYYLEEKDIGRNRAIASRGKLQSLNEYVQVQCWTDDLNLDVIRKHKVVVITESVHSGKHPMNLIEIADFCHSNSICFILAETMGVFSRLFCDFGPEFVILEPSAEKFKETPLVEFIVKPTGAIICQTDVNPPGISVGDSVKFCGVPLMKELDPTVELTIITINGSIIEISPIPGRFAGYKFTGGSIKIMSSPIKIQFQSLAESITNPKMMTPDFAKAENSFQSHIAFNALEKFCTTQGRFVDRSIHTDFDLFLQYASDCADLTSGQRQVDSSFQRLFFENCHGSLAPLNGIIGGFAAQEVMKACSGKFKPLHQWMFFDATECIPSNQSVHLQLNPDTANSRYMGQAVCIGNDVQTKLFDLRIFLVGAGAIGCELLKNFAMMGVGTSSKGTITITDMDSIERSNLNRQFLFRNSDVGKWKSSVAAEAIMQMNPDMRITSHTIKVGEETEETYDDEFFQMQDVVANALDNVAARAYMDEKCVEHLIPLLDSGTMGTQGSTMVILPHLTESYRSVRNPPAKAVPACTLKYFPYQIDHTIHWARDLFDKLFQEPAQLFQLFITNPRFDEGDSTRSDQLLTKMESILSVLEAWPRTFEDCVQWAKGVWTDIFSNQILQLIHTFPSDSLTESGKSFWFPPKKCPQPLVFAGAGDLELDFVFSAANLRAEMYGIPQNRIRSEVDQMARTAMVAEFILNPNITTSAYQDEEDSLPNIAAEVKPEEISKIALKVKMAYESLTSKEMHGLEFEKDDDKNLHIDFVTSASNCRARNYGIEEADKLKSKLIAGNIIPAIATTTSIVAGLISLELYKICSWILEKSDNSRKKFKNGFLNLATPLITFVNPSPPDKTTCNAKEFSLWNRFEIQGDCTLRELLNEFKQKHDLHITILSCGQYNMYNGYFEDSFNALIMDLTIPEVLRRVCHKPLKKNIRKLILQIICSNVSEEINLPPVFYYFPEP